MSIGNQNSGNQVGSFGVSGIVKKEMLRRESPRNRRQLMNNLAMWSQNQSQGMAVNGTNNNRQKPFANQLVSGLNTMGMMQHMQNMGSTGPQSSDLTFFDSKMLNNNGKPGSQRAPQQRQQLVQGSKYSHGHGHSHSVAHSQGHSHSHNQNSGPQFFNKTGPIKLSHNSRSAISTNPNMSTHSNTQQVDDILGNGSTDDIILQQKSAFSNTQKINNSLSGLNDDGKDQQHRGT